MLSSEAKLTVRNKVEKLIDLINEIYVDNLETRYIPEIKAIIMQEYDVELTGKVTDRGSRTNPIYYRDEFVEALDDFEFIIVDREEVTLTIPEVDNFNWTQGRLHIIENILEGAIGTYVELDEAQYIKLYGKRPVIQPFDKTVPIKERIYLLRYSPDLNRRWRENFPRDELIKYPFSNTPPIDIFLEANRYVMENRQSWINNSIKQARKEITR